MLLPGKVGRMSSPGANSDPFNIDPDKATSTGEDTGSDAPITAAADGSALGNPGPAGWAWYVNDNCWEAGGWPHGTNNMGELKAVLALLEATAEYPHRPLRILCDSQYVINCITRWMPGWKAKGWKKKDGKPVLNRDLLEQLDLAMTGRTYEFEWVKGHAGHELNEAADDRARAAATAFQQGQDPDPGPGFSSEETPLEAQARSAENASAATGDQPSRPQENSAESALEHERLLNRQATYTDSGSLKRLLADDLIWVTVRGRLADRAAAINYPEQAFGLRSDPEYLRNSAATDDSGLVVSRVETTRGPALRSSLWTRTPRGDWALSMRQDTLEA